jgi:hypothetical protein
MDAQPLAIAATHVAHAMRAGKTSFFAKIAKAASAGGSWIQRDRRWKEVAEQPARWPQCLDSLTGWQRV